MKPPALEIQNLSHSFEKENYILENINLIIKKIKLVLVLWLLKGSTLLYELMMINSYNSVEHFKSHKNKTSLIFVTFKMLHTIVWINDD